MDKELDKINLKTSKTLFWKNPTIQCVFNPFLDDPVTCISNLFYCNSYDHKINPHNILRICYNAAFKNSKPNKKTARVTPTVSDDKLKHLFCLHFILFVPFADTVVVVHRIFFIMKRKVNRVTQKSQAIKIKFDFNQKLLIEGS